MISEQDVLYLRQAIDLAKQARKNGNHPFGALLVDADGNLLLKAENTVVTGRDCTGHAETNLMRIASQWFDREFLAACTLYTSTEPCAMCAGAIHWAGVGRVVYGLSEAHLYTIIGQHPHNETLKLPCREVFARSDRAITILGPVLENEAAQVHRGFWQTHT